MLLTKEAASSVAAAGAAGTASAPALRVRCLGCEPNGFRAAFLKQKKPRDNQWYPQIPPKPHSAYYGPSSLTSLLAAAGQLTDTITEDRMWYFLQVLLTILTTLMNKDHDTALRSLNPKL